MKVATTAGNIARKLDRQFGIREWLKGEPRLPKGGFDLAGEKIIDWGWICVHLPPGPKRALEIGCGESPVLPAMLARGYSVVGVDFNPVIANELSGFTLVQGDFNEVKLPDAFDVIVSCSTIEHFGLAGRYGATTEDEGADLTAMRRIRSLLAPEGVVLITVPVGSDVVHKPWHRVYGRKRLPLLLDGFRIVESRFMVKSPWGPWHDTTEDAALSQPSDIKRYALGEFILTLT